MKKISITLGLLLLAMSASATGRGGFSLLNHSGNRTARTTSVKADNSDAVYDSVREQYAQGKISADSVINLALYHKIWSPATAEKCLKLVADRNPRAEMELGVIYAFSPEYTRQASEGVRLLQEAAKSGGEVARDANCYLGLYYFNHREYDKAKASFDACRPIPYGFGDTALGSMYMEGKGVKEDVAKARECYHQAALKGYARGASLYGFNLRATGGGPVSYPDSFFWLYIAGDLGDDAARTALYLPRRNENRGDGEVAQKANEALTYIEMAQKGKNLKNEPIYKDGFLPSLKAREQAAERGDDWARFYLGSMNYNGDFLNQNYAQAIRYYEPISRDAKLPRTVLALVNERLARMYSDGLGTKANPAKADQYARLAAHYGSLSAYKSVENH
ncbi:MAG: sel1 repeat family protein [Muribaculaceae bacterium]|nr:sel1 repeat family protein [Muribaculaceae bacterium]